jgi:hypothetical protein
MVKSRKSGKQLAGTSLSILGLGIGASVASTRTDGDVAQGLVTYLEDKRVLFNPEHLEGESEVQYSVQEIRTQLTDALQQVDPKGPAAEAIKAMRAACRQYLDGPRQHFQHMGVHMRGMNEPGFFLALGELRARFGVELKRLDNLFGITMEPQLRALFLAPDKSSR